MSVDDHALSPAPVVRLRGILDRTRSTSDPNLGATRLADAASPSPSAHSLPRSVSFAPLPEIPKKKKGRNGRLGIANRAAIMRRRIHTYDDAVMFDEGYDNPNGTTVTYEGVDGDEMDRLRSLRVKSPGTEQDDPFTAIGRFVKGASRGLWRKMSLSGSHEPAITIVKPSDGHVHVVGATDCAKQLAQPFTPLEHAERRGDAGGVWEEEIDPRYHRAQSNTNEPLPVRSLSPGLAASPPSSDGSSALSTPAPSLDGTDDPPRTTETGTNTAPGTPGKPDTETSVPPEPVQKTQS